MKKIGIITALACACALCFALVGCGGNSNGEDAKKAFIGTWDLVEMTQDGQVTGTDELKALKSLGLEVYANLNEDGTAALVLFGEAISGTWEASSPTAGKITLEGSTVDMSITDSKLKFEQSNASLTFQKGDKKETPSSSSSSSSSSDSSSSSSSNS